MTDPVTTMQTAVPALAGAGTAAVAIYVLRHGADRASHLLFAAAGLVWSTGLFAAAFAPLMGADTGVAERLGVVASLLAPTLWWALSADHPRPSPLLVRTPAARALFAVPPLAGAWLIGGRVTALRASTVVGVHALVVFVLAVLPLLLVRARPEGAPERSRASQMVLATVGLAAVATAGIVAPDDVALSLVWPIVVLAAVASVGYSILKFDLVGFDQRLRSMAKYLVTTGVLVAVLFLVSGYVGEFVLEPMFGFTDYYWFIAGIVGLLLFKPLENLVEWATGKILPAPDAGGGEAALAHGLNIYQAQVQYILRDGAINAKERAFLDTLRDQLMLPVAEARRIEGEAKGARAAPRAAVKPAAPRKAKKATAAKSTARRRGPAPR